ncbi:hypothetical protein U1Q18_012906 [Sarracenia purpurea var. burkii]
MLDGDLRKLLGVNIGGAEPSLLPRRQIGIHEVVLPRDQKIQYWLSMNSSHLKRTVCEGLSQEALISESVSYYLLNLAETRKQALNKNDFNKS